MGVPAPLSRKLRDKLGSEAGEELVTWLAEMRAEHEAMRADMHAMELRLVDRLSAMEGRINERIVHVEVRVADVQSNLMKWSFVFWCGAVAAIAALAGVLRP